MYNGQFKINIRNINLSQNFALMHWAIMYMNQSRGLPRDVELLTGQSESVIIYCDNCNNNYHYNVKVW